MYKSWRMSQHSHISRFLLRDTANNQRIKIFGFYILHSYFITKIHLLVAYAFTFEK